LFLCQDEEYYLDERLFLLLIWGSFICEQVFAQIIIKDIKYERLFLS